MKLNWLEFALMNNPVRAALQWSLEARQFRQLGAPLGLHRVLEVGCGRGVGVEILLSRFQARRVDGFDLDDRMVNLAARRLNHRRNQVTLWTGDIAQILADDSTYDAVFDFGAIHHVPDWETAVREVFRVLKPGGRFYAEEVSASFIQHWIVRRLLKHPAENRFGHIEFIDALNSIGFSEIRHRDWLGLFFWVTAQKPSPAR